LHNHKDLFQKGEHVLIKSDRFRNRLKENLNLDVHFGTPLVVTLNSEKQKGDGAIGMYDYENESHKLANPVLIEGSIGSSHLQNDHINTLNSKFNSLQMHSGIGSGTMGTCNPRYSGCAGHGRYPIYVISEQAEIENQYSIANAQASELESDKQGLVEAVVDENTRLLKENDL
jgi:hypothetical protein